jgi:hypothetical protein
MARENGMVEAECALGRECMECDTAHDRVGAASTTIEPGCTPLQSVNDIP